jgi:8-oxo-dGTP pyrophosphatase MutT (NUDIX family)
LKRARIVTSFLEHGGKILILKRSDSVRTYRGKWAGVSGSIEADESPLQAAVREICEETGLGSGMLTPAGQGVRLEVVDGGLGVKWEIHAFLFTVDSPAITIEGEHTEFKWIDPSEIDGYDAVPELARSLRLVLEKRTQLKK